MFINPQPYLKFEFLKMSTNDAENNLELDSLLIEESLLKDSIMKTFIALDNEKQKLKSLQVQMELYSSNLKITMNKKGDLLQQQWKIVNQQEQKSREKTKEKIQLLIMEDQQKIRFEILENKKVIQENTNYKSHQEYSNIFNKLILERKMYEMQLYDLEQEIGKNDKDIGMAFNNFNKWILEKH